MMENPLSHQNLKYYTSIHTHFIFTFWKNKWPQITICADSKAVEKCLGKLIKNPKGKRQETQDKGDLKWRFMGVYVKLDKNCEDFTHHKKASTVERRLNNIVQPNGAVNLCQPDFIFVPMTGKMGTDMKWP